MAEFHIGRQTKAEWLQCFVGLGAFIVFVGFLVTGLFERNFGDHEILTLV